mgnify:CR=1 FL=1
MQHRLVRIEHAQCGAAEQNSREQLAKQGMNAAGGPPERLGNLVKNELTRWARVVKEANIHVE